MKTKIIFFGTEDFSAPTLSALIDHNYDVVAVITKPDTARGRGHKVDSPIVKKIAEQHGIPVFQPEKSSEIYDFIVNLGENPNERIGVLVAYGKIIPSQVLDLFPRGIINIHPSLLPKLRGPSPVETAIANGADVTGASIMRLVSAMDAGPVYAQEKIKLNGDETGSGLRARLSELGAKMLIDRLPQILSDEIAPKPQDDSKATYCQLLTRADGYLDPTKLTAVECDARIRAFDVWPRTRINFLGREIIVTRAHVETSETPSGVKCRDGQWLVIDELVAPSGKKMKTADYLRGLHV